jgi:hypothetical protein
MRGRLVELYEERKTEILEGKFIAQPHYLV